MKQRKKTELKLDQYLRLDSIKKVNEMTELGYRLHSFQLLQVSYDMYQEFYIMYLDKGNYEGVTNLADVSPSDVDQYLANGWEIASTSISTKFVRMIKRSV